MGSEMCIRDRLEQVFHRTIPRALEHLLERGKQPASDPSRVACAHILRAAGNTFGSGALYFGLLFALLFQYHLRS